MNDEIYYAKTKFWGETNDGHFIYPTNIPIESIHIKNMTHTLQFDIRATI